MDNRGDIRRVYYTNWDQMRIDRVDDWFLSQLDKAVEGYNEFYRQDFSQVLRRYRLDYLLSFTKLTTEEEGILGISSSPIEVGEKFIYIVD